MNTFKQLQQSDPNGYIAVSPDGNTIAYFADMLGFGLGASTVQYYSYLGGSDYSYNSISGTDISILANSIQFTDSNNIFYISAVNDANVRHIKFDSEYCLNTGFLDYP
jgi:hypothetical protein